MNHSVRQYHEFTKHTVEKLRRLPHVLDWANMPDPYRHYEGVPVLDLPADSTLDEAQQDGSAFLSCLLFHSAAISASKLAPRGDYRYALRVNPSSGNLHPTEFHFFTRGLRAWPDGAYHYRPSSHMAEQRGAGAFIETPGVQFLLTTVAWREAWKYRDRAYRYCLLDAGHAAESLALAAAWMGCRVTLAPADPPPPDWSCAPDEWPLLSIALEGGPLEASTEEPRRWFGGAPNRLSPEVADYPRIAAVHQATAGDHWLPAPPPGPLPSAPPFERSYPEASRTRRSALDFVGGDMRREQFDALLRFAAPPVGLRLWLYVHGVQGLEPGLYLWDPNAERAELRRSGPQRVAAAGLSLGQDLAGNCSVAFSMTADLDRGYRAAFVEAGRVGQRLYVAAEALGLRATGIGAFFDDQVHRHLGLDEDGPEQVVYHFAVGHPLPDPRINA